MQIIYRKWKRKFSPISKTLRNILVIHSEQEKFSLSIRPTLKKIRNKIIFRVSAICNRQNFTNQTTNSINHRPSEVGVSPQYMQGACIVRSALTRLCTRTTASVCISSSKERAAQRQMSAVGYSSRSSAVKWLTRKSNQVRRKSYSNELKPKLVKCNRISKQIKIERLFWSPTDF